MTDPIADMLSRIRNAIAAGKPEVNMPYSKLKDSLGKVLAREHFIQSVNTSGKGTDKTLTVVINSPGSNAAICHIKRISRPSKRYHCAAKDIPTVKRGRGIVVISTSKGLMTGAEAKKKGLGGELICEVY